MPQRKRIAFVASLGGGDKHRKISVSSRKLQSLPLVAVNFLRDSDTQIHIVDLKIPGRHRDPVQRSADRIAVERRSGFLLADPGTETSCGDLLDPRLQRRGRLCLRENHGFPCERSIEGKRSPLIHGNRVAHCLPNASRHLMNPRLQSKKGKGFHGVTSLRKVFPGTDLKHESLGRHFPEK